MSRLLLSVIFLSISVSFLKAQGDWITCSAPVFHARVDDIFMVDTQTGYAVCGDGKIVKTTNGGDNWNLLVQDSTVYCRSVEFVNAQKGFVGAFRTTNVDTNNIFRKTEDGGASWTDLTQLLHPRARAGICGLAVADEMTIYGCGNWFQDSAYIVKSVDGGTTWGFIDMSAYATSLIDMYWLNANVGFVTGRGPKPVESGIILYTTDGGVTWEVKFQNNISHEYCWKIQKLTDQVYFASLEDLTATPATILKSTDGGMTWNPKTVTTNTYDLEGIGFLNAYDGWAGGGVGSSYFSHDGGETWNLMDVPLVYLNRLYRVNDTLMLASGTTIWKYTDATAGIGTLGEGLSSYSSLTGYPNPSDDLMNLQLVLDRPTRVMLTLFDATGREITEIDNSYQSQGLHNYTISTANLPSGIYHLSLRTHTDKQSLQLVVAH